MTTTQQARRVRVYSIEPHEDYDDPMDYEVREDMIDPSLFNVQLMLLLGQWAANEADLQERLGRWDQGLWAKVQTDQGTREYLPFLTDDEGYEGVRPAPNVCGSAYCMAGQAAVLSEYRLLYGPPSGITGYASTDNCVKTEPTGEVDDKGRMIYVDVPDSFDEIANVAARELGIAECEGDLFDGENCVTYIHARINAMCEDRGIDLLFPEADITHYSHDGYEHDHR